jgi:hypothetical protein
MPRPLLPPNALRKPVELYLAENEREAIEAKAREAGLALSSFVRKAALGQKVATLPQPNAVKWEQLARLSANVNQIARAANAGTVVSVDGDLLKEVATLVRHLRLDLVGAAEDM